MKHCGIICVSQEARRFKRDNSKKYNGVDRGGISIRYIIRWLPVLMIVSSIFLLSSIPNLHIVPDSLIPAKVLYYLTRYSLKIGDHGFFSYVINLHPDFIMHKLGHVAVFSLLGVALYFAVFKSIRLAWLLSIIVAVSDEFHQFFVYGRSSRFGDIILDSIAALCAILLVRHFSNPRN